MMKIELPNAERFLLDQYGSEYYNQYKSEIKPLPKGKVIDLTVRAKEICQHLNRVGKFDLARIIGVWYEYVKKRIGTESPSSIIWLGVN